MLSFGKILKRMIYGQNKLHTVRITTQRNGLLGIERNQYLDKNASSQSKASKRKDFGVYNIVEPGNVTESLVVPNNIEFPTYAYGDTLNNMNIPEKPEVKNSKEIEAMRKSCSMAQFILEFASKTLKVGITTDEIDKAVFDLCIEKKIYPSPLNYHGFPKSICTSVNNVACHGIPDDRPLCDGDIINIDVSVYVNGYHGDCSETYAVGNVDEKGICLMKATEQCLKEGIAVCRDGEYFSSIGQVINETAVKFGFNVVPCFTGHGIGKYFQGPPDIYHFHNDFPGVMKCGMTFTIEPVLTQGDPEIIILEDGWTAVTADNARTAQFEHTILITPNGAEVLTL